MRHLVVLVAVLTGCSSPSSPRAPEYVSESPPPGRAAPVHDLTFNDDQLQIVATALAEEARLRGIEEARGRNRVERLISLEASLGRSTAAMDRVNALASHITMSDASQWAKLRQKSEREFAIGNDPVATRVRTLLAGWQRRKSEEAHAYLSSNYSNLQITSREWERRFHGFISERPVDAATWGWLVWRELGPTVRQQYGRADAEHAYRFYLEFTGLGDGREARRIFSVPGTQIAASPDDDR